MCSPSVQLNGVSLRQTPPHEALRSYQALNLELGSIVQAAMRLCRELNDDEGQRLYQALLARIAEDRFNLAVLGSFNRGKSTLMNAILGMDRLPTGVLPHTSVITTVTYGSQEKVLIRCAGWPIPQEIPLEKLAQYVTEQGNPSNYREVISAEIQIPSEILRQGLYFIDTPGAGSGIAANSAATEGFIPEIDAAIFVSSVESPIGENELRFLHRVYDEVRRVFVVINKLDLLPQKDCDEVIRFAGQRLDAELGAGNYDLFALSARSGLDAKLSGDTRAFASSGLPQLEQALWAFLQKDKLRQVSDRSLDRLVRLLKRQQIELSIALATNDHNDTAKELHDRFSNEVGKLSAQAASMGSLLRGKVSRAIADEIAAPIDSLFLELGERVTRKFLGRLASRSVLLHRPQSSRILQEAAAFCEQAINEWLAGSAALVIQPATSRIGGQTLVKLLRAPEEVSRIAAECAEPHGSPGTLNAGYSDPAASIPSSLGLPHLQHTPWPQLAPRRLGLLPLRKREEVARRWFSKSTSDALAQYRKQLVALIKAAVADSITALTHEVEGKIRDAAARITSRIGSPECNAQAREIRELLHRAARLRDQLKAPEMTNGSAAAEPETDVALGDSQCPICVQVAEVLFAFLSKFQFTIGASEEGQASHAERGGFCAIHTWMYAEMTSPQGICLAYPRLLSGVSRRLMDRVESQCGTDDLDIAVRLILRRSRNCPVCAVVENMETEIASEVARGWTREAIRTDGLPVLCLVHLQKVLAAGPSDAMARALSERTARGLERCADNMRRYALKHDAIRRNLLTGEERIAYILGLARVACDKRLVAHWVKNEL
ncbi:MAG TPA: dynamin family protein [Candidatus Binataceae bacterium]|nr:dynamin family protein [Candidatus Binataceae bacterium]